MWSPSASASVFSGGIIERDNVDPPKALAPLNRAGDAHKTGFPTPQWKARPLGQRPLKLPDAAPSDGASSGGGSSSSSSSSAASVVGLLPPPPAPRAPPPAADASTDAAVDDNMKLIMSMSAGQLAEAQSELEAMFRPETLAAIKRRAAGKYGSDVGAMLAPTRRTEPPVPRRDASPPRTAAAAAVAAAAPSQDSSRAHFLGAPTPEPFPPPTFASVAATEGELRAWEQSAPGDVRAALAWAIDDDVPADADADADAADGAGSRDRQVTFDPHVKPGGTGGKAGKARAPRAVPRARARAATDRFDLKGRKVVERGSAIADVAAALSAGGYFTGWGVSAGTCHAWGSPIMWTGANRVSHVPLSDPVTLSHTPKKNLF